MEREDAVIQRVSFRQMSQGTKEDYDLLANDPEPYGDDLATRLLKELEAACDVESRHLISRLGHSLQTATRALRDDADEEMIVVALLHDVGDRLAPSNHAEFAASVLRPFVSRENYWLVKHHGVFQGYYFFHHHGFDRNARDRFKGDPNYERTAAFCEDWDQASFDPSYDTLPIEHFEPMVARVLATPRPPYA